MKIGRTFYAAFPDASDHLLGQHEVAPIAVLGDGRHNAISYEAELMFLRYDCTCRRRPSLLPNPLEDDFSHGYLPFDWLASCFIMDGSCNAFSLPVIGRHHCYRLFMDMRCILWPHMDRV